MKAEIVNFIKKCCQKYGLKAIYTTAVHGKNDLYSITTKTGIPIMNFTTEIFYNISPRIRERMFLPTIKRGLNQLLGERNLQDSGQLFRARRMGKPIC